MPAPSSDADALRRLAAGDRSALGTLYDDHAAAVFGLLLRMCQRRSEAEELLQEVFLQAWRGAGRYDAERASPRTWLLMIARSRAIDAIRSATARGRREADSVSRAGWDSHRVQPPEGLERLQEAERRQRVHRALAALPEEQRRAVELAFFAGLTHRQVAERLETPLGTVKSRILLGMKKLRQNLGSP